MRDEPDGLTSAQSRRARRPRPSGGCMVAGAGPGRRPSHARARRPAPLEHLRDRRSLHHVRLGRRQREPPLLQPLRRPRLFRQGPQHRPHRPPNSTQSVTPILSSSAGSPRPPIWFAPSPSASASHRSGGPSSGTPSSQRSTPPSSRPSAPLDRAAAYSLAATSSTSLPMKSTAPVGTLRMTNRNGRVRGELCWNGGGPQNDNARRRRRFRACFVHAHERLVDRLRDRQRIRAIDAAAPKAEGIPSALSVSFSAKADSNSKRGSASVTVAKARSPSTSPTSRSTPRASRPTKLRSR